jgi:hypothetical protein
LPLDLHKLTRPAPADARELQLPFLLPELVPL